MSQLSLITGNALKSLPFDTLNPMQVEMLSSCKNAKQVILHAPTGSGKTVAYLLPVLEKMAEIKPGIRAMVIVPSRELALQIEQVFRSMSTGLKVSTCYGGHKVKTEKNNLIEAPTLLIGTPGRIAYHLDRGNIDARTIDYLILDEFDKSLEYGFEKDMSFIFSFLPESKLLILTSATKISVTPDFLKIQHPKILDFSPDSEKSTLQIKILRSDEKDKLALLMKLLCTIEDGMTIVFCNHRDAVERISRILEEQEILHDTYHGGYEQSQRERALLKFRNGSTTILITTDLASRGLDITGVKNIIHYQPANSENVFIHRNGRTARMESEGTAWILLSSEERIPEFVPAKTIEPPLVETKKWPTAPSWSTIYFGAGKKDKLSKVDIVGLLIQKGNLSKEEIGLISILDYESFVAVPRSKASGLVRLLQIEKIKNKKVKIALSN